MSHTQILVVEDEGIIAKCIQSELENMGYRVPTIASTGEEALQQVAGAAPDLVLMDIVLKGGMDGIETAEQIRASHDVPIVYLTAYEDESILRRARATEPYGYLLKPYEEKELHTTIEIALYKHRMEQRIKEAERWLSAILHSIDDAVIATDARQCVRFLNPVAEALTGCHRDDALGKDLAEVCAFHDYRTGVPLEGPAARAVQHGATVALPEHCALRGRDGRDTPVEGSASPIHDPAGNFTGITLVFRDVSDRVQMDKLRELSEEHLRQAQKMEAIGRLAGGVAHDFNNLLTAILGNTSLVLSSLPKEDPNGKLMAQIEAAALRAAELVKHLLAVSGRCALRAEATNLNETVQQTIERFRKGLDPRVEVEFEPGEDLWLVYADANQLGEAILNLCLNARDAMPRGGTLTLETANVTITPEHLRAELDAQPGEFVRLRAYDTGCGIAPEIRPRIFEPFFTTKEADQGAGLGLALVFGIVQEHHGWIEVESTVGFGACFDLYLPRYGPATLAAPPALANRVRRSGPETILLADDEPMVRDLGSEILKRSGYQVLAVEDGMQAVEVYQREGHRIDLVILDLTMPRLSGHDAFRQLLRIDPEVRVLFSSGYFADHVSAEHAHILGFIGKPYGREKLAQTVRSALDSVKQERMCAATRDR
ncbi:MAG: response regulator [Gemmataceae bacterium]|nr:response regulator [Gemmataceae bacterium]